MPPVLVRDRPDIKLHAFNMYKWAAVAFPVLVIPTFIHLVAADFF